MRGMSPTAPVEAARAERVLLFDGECGLCQALVQFLLRRARARRLWFAPLQGATAQAYLRERGLPTEDFETAVYVPAWRERPREFLVRNDAVLAVLAELGGAWRAVRVLRVLPRSWRDAAYRWWRGCATGGSARIGRGNGRRRGASGFWRKQSTRPRAERMVHLTGGGGQRFAAATARAMRARASVSVARVQPKFRRT